MTQERPAYDKLVALIKDRHDNKISDQEAHRLARNLMGYTELVIRVAARESQNDLDNQGHPDKVKVRKRKADVECRNSCNYRET
jgi:hypothetical protein